MSDKSKKAKRPNLTARFCESVSPLDRIVEYHDGPTNLVLRVLPNGKKNWSMRYRAPSGKQRRHDFGEFPGLSLADARTEFLEARLLIKRGGDPADKRRLLRDEAKRQQEAATVATVGALYLQACEEARHKKKVKRRKRQHTIDCERYYFEQHIRPALGHYPIDQLKRAMVQELADRLVKSASRSTPRFVVVTLHAIYSYAIWQDFVQFNPCMNVAYPTSRPRRTSLTDDQIRTVWHTFTPPVVVPDVKVSDGVAYAIQLALVTGQRIGEVAQMKISQIDFENSYWRIPEDVTKNGREHLVPLSPLALDLIHRAIELRGDDPRDAVFPSPRKAKESILSGAATHAFTKVREALGWPDIRIHDLRRTVATNLAKPPISTAPFYVSKVLNHVSDTGGAAAVTGVYNLWEYLDEKREALVAWEKRLRQILVIKAVIDGAKAS